MLTLSGRLVLPGNDVAPSLSDIAVSLGRTPRFSGQTVGWWTVLHHLHVCAALVKWVVPPRRPAREHQRMRLHAYLHDAHEAVTGDITTAWKSPEMREYQAELDQRIYTDLCVSLPNAEERGYLKTIDRLALVAEGHEMGPRGICNVLNETPEDFALEAVRQVRETYLFIHEDAGPMEAAYTERVTILVHLLKGIA